MKDNIENLITNFIKELEKYPDIDHLNMEDLFAKRNLKDVKIVFFKQLLKYLDNDKMIDRIKEEIEVKDVEDAFEKWNAPKSRVRNGMLLIGINCL